VPEILQDLDVEEVAFAGFIATRASGSNVAPGDAAFGARVPMLRSSRVGCGFRELSLASQPGGAR
jgi:hypothetical protein